MYTPDEMDKELIAELLKRFPEFATSKERSEVYDNDGPYIYYSYFGDFLLEKMRSDPSSEIVSRAFKYINEIYNKPDLTAKEWDLFGNELFERFEMTEEYKSFANEHLQGNALQAFQGKLSRPTN